MPLFADPDRCLRDPADNEVTDEVLKEAMSNMDLEEFVAEVWDMTNDAQLLAWAKRVRRELSDNVDRAMQAD